MSIFLILVILTCVTLVCFVVLAHAIESTVLNVTLGVVALLLFIAMVVVGICKDEFPVIKSCQSGQYKCEGMIHHTLCLEHDWYGTVCETSEIPKEAFME